MKQQDKLRIAILQLDTRVGEVVYNRLQIRNALIVAAGYSANLAITPELAEYGCYFTKCMNVRSIPYFPSSFITTLQQIAYKYDMHLMIGTPVREQEKVQIYNGLVHINSQGLVQAVYKKVSCNEQALTSGQHLCCTNVCDVNVGLLIGEDAFTRQYLDAERERDSELVVVAACNAIKHYEAQQLREWTNAYQIPIILSNTAKGRKQLGGECMCIQSGAKEYTFKVCEPQVIIVDYNKHTKRLAFIEQITIK